MARFLAKIPSSRSIEETFDYLADFSTTGEWDPSVVVAERTSSGDIREGSTFDVSVALLGTTSSLSYAIVAYERPTRVVLLGENATIRSFDEITFVPVEGVCQVVYDAQLTIKAPELLRPVTAVADLWLSALFQWSGARSAAGLEAALSDDQPLLAGHRSVEQN